jgi:competence protein ComEC
VVDGRLLLPAGGAWAGAAVSLVGLGAVPEIVSRHHWAVWILIGCVGGLAIGAGFVWIFRDRRWCAPFVAVSAGVVVGVIAATAQVMALTADPLGGWISERRSATIIGVIADEPQTRVNTMAAPWEGAQRTTVRMATSQIAVRGDIVKVHVPVVIRVDDVDGIPPPGTFVLVSGRLAPTNPLRHAAANVIADGPMAVIAAPGIVDRMTTAMRSGLRSAVAFLPADVGSLIAGLSVGDESQSPPELTDAMLGSGLSHLTAVSGGNVAIVVVAVLGLAALVRLAMLARIALALGALAFFVILVQPEPSVLRAAFMGGIVLLGMITGGRRAGPSILATSVIALMVLAPHLAVAWGFALSVAATGGLILIAPWCRRWIDTWQVTARWPMPVREGLAITGAAQLATLPLLVAMGGAVGWVALPANLLAMPAVAPVTIFGLLAAISGPLWPPLAVAWSALAAPGAWWISRVATVSADLPGAQFPWPGGWFAALALAALLAVAWWWRRYLRLALPVIIAVWIVWTIAPPDRRAWPPPNWIIVSCAVGQGDAHVIRIAPGSALLIDVGPDPQAIDTCLRDLGIEEIPAIILSHFHADHVNGLLGATAGRQVGAIITTPLFEPAEQFEAVEMWRGNIPLQTVRFGEVRAIGGITWKVIWPRRVIDAGSRPNNTSAVVLVQIGDRLALFTGDIEPTAQQAILGELPRQPIDIVKVPHHGSKYQLPALPQRTGARIALVSVGDGNRYGHPAEQTLAAWQHIGAVIGRTDTDGDLAVVSDTELGLVRRSR